MINLLSIGGMDFSDYGAYVVSVNPYDAPARQYEKASVPGRNGDLIFDSKKYPNISMEFAVIFPQHFGDEDVFDRFRNDLLSMVGYQRVVDTVHPNEYRLGYVDGGIKPSTYPDFGAGKCRFTLNCKPQRFLTIGEAFVEVFNEGTLNNPTNFEAYPIIKVTGYGTLSIGNNSIIIEQHDTTAFPYIEIDADTQDATYDGANANQYVRFVDDKQPVLSRGENGIEFDNTITKVEIEPRWWML